MTTFTSSLPDELLEKLSNAAKDLKLPKNRVIERALELYLDQLQRAKYVKSFKRAAKEKEIIQIAEEGMADYYEQLKDFD